MPATSSLAVTRSAVRVAPDPSRVLAKSFLPGGEVRADGRMRIEHILLRILALSESQVDDALDEVRGRFSRRHRDLERILEANFAIVEAHVHDAQTLSLARRLLIGAYFTQEYGVEAAALSNPSIVAAPNQEGLAEGAVRFVLSLRAIGEGHISSIEFRLGVVDAAGRIELDPPGPHVSLAMRQVPDFDKPVFRSKLRELRAYDAVAAGILDSLPDDFSLHQLECEIRAALTRLGENASGSTRMLHWLASSNYVSRFSADSTLSERILFPAGPPESQGMEDARFVRFTGDDGVCTYFATYTAFDGYRILPQLIETPDFLTFRTATLNGECARNKGIALFPRKLGGRYAALARLDNENNFFMSSDNIHFWHESRVIQRPKHSWEIIQLGNCGSPIETEAGWLVITHGVGTMRQYALGALLLDREDPTLVLGQLAEPLLTPAEDERDGYVPNVVYSCGSMIAAEHLILPYGHSDVGTRIATVRLDDLLGALTASC